jgi:hypothetical protein
MLRHLTKRSKSQVAVRVQQREAFSGQEVLPDQIEKQRTLAGTGLTDNVKMSTVRGWIEHDRTAQHVSTDA